MEVVRDLERAKIKPAIVAGFVVAGYRYLLDMDPTDHPAAARQVL